MSKGLVEGRVALITGAARGQGRSHAERLASEGATVVAVDIAAPVETVTYPMPSLDDLAETVAIVEASGGKIRSFQADVRDRGAMNRIVASTLEEFGRIDIVVANAGIATYDAAVDLTSQQWDTMIGVNLTGVWNTVQPVLKPMIEAARGGSIILTSSNTALKTFEHAVHYTSAKHGLVGMMRVLAKELGRHNIRVNTIHPTGVATGMLLNDTTYRLFRPDLESPTKEDCLEGFHTMQVLPIPWVEAADVSNAVVWLASDEARYITGASLPVDGGCQIT
jgi:SDR family mycofactocin-dependent oxidoreductase